MIRILIFSLLIAIPSIASAEGDNYVSIKGGLSKSLHTGDTAWNNSVNGFYNHLQSNVLETGYVVGVSYGKYFTSNYRLELELTQREDYVYDAYTAQTTIHQRGEVKATTLLINGFYDFEPLTINKKSITPYFGGGIGVSSNRLGATKMFVGNEDLDQNFQGDFVNDLAYKLSAGTLFGITEKLSLDMNYQYINLGAFEGGDEIHSGGRFNSVKLANRQGGEIKAHEFMIGLQYKF